MLLMVQELSEAKPSSKISHSCFRQVLSIKIPQFGEDMERRLGSRQVFYFYFFVKTFPLKPEGRPASLCHPCLLLLGHLLKVLFLLKGDGKSHAHPGVSSEVAT